MLVFRKKSKLLTFVLICGAYSIQLAKTVVEEIPPNRSTLVGRTSVTLRTTPLVPPPSKTTLRTAVSLPPIDSPNRPGEKR